MENNVCNLDTSVLHPSPCNFSLTKEDDDRVANVRRGVFKLYRDQNKCKEPEFFQACIGSKCETLDKFVKCVKQQWNLRDLDRNEQIRENYLKVKDDIEHPEADAHTCIRKVPSLMQIDCPPESENSANVPLKPSSPTHSLTYVPAKKLLDVKSPRSGIFLNEKPIDMEADIPFLTYNPRQLQEQVDVMFTENYDICKTHDDKMYVKLSNAEDMILDPANCCKLTKVPPTNIEDCIFYKPQYFVIPELEDLEKTFKYDVIIGPKTEKCVESTPRRPVEMAIIFVAFAISVRENPKMWMKKKLQAIVKDGCKLIKRSIYDNYKSEESNFDIIRMVEEKSVSLKLTMLKETCFSADINILQLLTILFESHSNLVFHCVDVYLLLIKMCESTFCIFDPAGRNECLNRDESRGAALITFDTIEHIVYFIYRYNNCIQEANIAYTIYDISLESLGIIKKIKRPKKKVDDRLTIINKYYAVISGGFGLEQPKDNKTKNPSMMVSYIALLYYNIDPPRHWKRITVDSLVKIGVKYYQGFLNETNLKNVNIKTIPEVIVIGVFRGLMSIDSYFQSGTINEECFYYKNSPLTHSLYRFFEKYKAGLLQIDISTVMAIFTDSEFFYVFDPFIRGLAGEVIDEDIVGFPALQIHTNIESMAKMIYKNALAVKTTGAYFFHGVEIDSINLLLLNKHIKQEDALNTLLKILYPAECEVTKIENIDYVFVNRCVPAECLSVLSVSPNQRTCFENIDTGPDKCRKKIKPIERLPPCYPDFDEKDLIDLIVKELICEIMTTIKNREDAKAAKAHKAKKVLLKTDEGYLRKLQRKIKHRQALDKEEFNDIFKQKYEDKYFELLTLEKELKIKSNFRKLPDGNWIICGSRSINTECSDRIGFVAAIVSIILSTKYKICTWNSEIISFLMDSGKTINEEFEPDTLTLILKNMIPKIQIGETLYCISLTKMADGKFLELSEHVECCLGQTNRILVVFNTFACSIFKRYNFFYMFIGFPGDYFGFRTLEKGTPSFLRFIFLRDLINRIDFDRYSAARNQEFVIMKVDINILNQDFDHFIFRTESKENKIYEKLIAEKKKYNDKYKSRLTYVCKELQKEKKRKAKFEKEKIKHFMKGCGGNEVNVDEIGIEEESSADECECEEEQEAVKWKHEYGTVLEYVDPLYYIEKPIRREVGYKLRKEECLFKIQGTTSLTGRMEGTSICEIKACFVASIYAILNLIIMPIHKWDFRRIDKIIEKSNLIFNRVPELDSNINKIFNRIEIDDYSFNVRTRQLKSYRLSNAPIDDFFVNNKNRKKEHLLLQTPKTTFALYQDEFYHLFDPYESVLPEDDGEEDEGCCPIKSNFHDHKAASWILFPNLEKVFEYIDGKTDTDWKNDFKFHIIEIFNFKRLPKKTLPFKEKIFEDGKEDIRKLRPEEICWLDIQPDVIPWSRTTIFNLVKVDRGTKSSEDRAYEIEIPTELFSLWGTIHPLDPMFKKSRGHQYLAVNVFAFCMAQSYQVLAWNSKIIDSIVRNGDKYFRESVKEITQDGYEISLEDLNTVYKMGSLEYKINIQAFTWGMLYEQRKDQLNLSRSLTYFFSNCTYGVLQCMGRSLAFGRTTKGYFMFDCQAIGEPLFEPGQGAAYCLQCSNLQRLLHCIILTLNFPFYNLYFNIHSVELEIVELDAVDATEDEEEEQEECDPKE